KTTFWHSSAHLMAEAVEALFPGAKFWVGPAVDNGFYYDIDLGGRSITEEDLRKLEVKMSELAKNNSVYVRKEISKADAIHYFSEKGDHRKLGKELSIFTMDDDVGPGLPLWLPNGTIIIEELEKLAKETELDDGYKRVVTPHIAKESMYLKSGHLPYYQESMYPPMELEGVKYYLKSMNCPHHHKIFAAEPKSYKDLPLRLAEYGTCYRYEQSGELFGLMR